MKSRIDSPLGRPTRRTATVMISAPAASCASRMTSIEEYLPVPTIRRDVNSLPPRTRLVSYMPLTSPFRSARTATFAGSPHGGSRRSARTATHRANDLDLVAVGEGHRIVVGLAGDFPVDGDRRVLALDVEQGEQTFHGEAGLDLHRLAVDADLHRHERPLPLQGYGRGLPRHRV